MKFIPFGPRALIRPIAEVVSNKSKVMMPDTAKEKPVEGVIVAIGQGVLVKYTSEYDKLGVNAIKWEDVEIPEVGDRVLFGKYAGSAIKIDGEDLLIMHIDELLGRMEGLEAPPTVNPTPPQKKGKKGSQ